MNYLNLDCKAIPSTFVDKDGVKHDYIRVVVTLDEQTFKLAVRDCDKLLFNYLVKKNLSEFDED